MTLKCERDEYVLASRGLSRLLVVHRSLLLCLNDLALFMKESDSSCGFELGVEILFEVQELHYMPIGAFVLVL